MSFFIQVPAQVQALKIVVIAGLTAFTLAFARQVFGLALDHLQGDM